jgi:hypothetical protein
MALKTSVNDAAAKTVMSPVAGGPFDAAAPAATAEGEAAAAGLTAGAGEAAARAEGEAAGDAAGEAAGDAAAAAGEATTEGWDAAGDATGATVGGAAAGAEVGAGGVLGAEHAVTSNRPNAAVRRYFKADMRDPHGRDVVWCARERDEGEQLFTGGVAM